MATSTLDVSSEAYNMILGSGVINEVLLDKNIMLTSQCVFRTVLKIMLLNNEVQQLRKYRPYLGNFLVISVTMAHNIQRLSKRFQQLLRALVRFAEQRHRVGLCWVGHSYGGPWSLFTPSLSPVNETDVFSLRNGL